MAQLYPMWIELGLADVLAVDGDAVAEPGLLTDPDRIWLVARAGVPLAGATLVGTP